MPEPMVGIIAAWTKSSFSGNDGCVEVRRTPSGVEIRDSKRATGQVLEFDEHEWAAFLRGVRNGEFDVHP